MFPFSLFSRLSSQDRLFPHQNAIDSQIMNTASTISMSMSTRTSAKKKKYAADDTPRTLLRNFLTTGGLFGLSSLSTLFCHSHSPHGYPPHQSEMSFHFTHAIRTHPIAFSESSNSCASAATNNNNPAALAAFLSASSRVRA